MEYIDPEYEENNNKGNKTIKILIGSSIVVFIIIMVLLYLITSISANQFTAYIDDQQISTNNNLFLVEGDKVYVSIRGIAPLLSYSYKTGEYKSDVNDTNKCYVESQNETASFFLNSNKISKVVPGSTEDYNNYTISEPVKKINDEMYVLTEGIEIAFNVSCKYNQQRNAIQIYTIPKIIQNWSPKILQAGYELASENDFNNSKTVLRGMFVVKKNSQVGVINSNMQEVVVTRYNDIQFEESTKEFFVTSSQNKVGILTEDGNTKITPQYDEIKVLDRELGLYVIKTNNNYGVINSTGSNVIYPEYEQVGIDGTQFPNDTITNQYLLFDNAIPVRYSNKWGLFDKSGKKILDVAYDSLGSMGTTTRDKASNVLLIDEYEAIVVCRDKLYGLVNSAGQELIPCALSSIYTTSQAGVKNYYMIYGELTLDVREYLNQVVKKSTSTTNTNTNTNTTQQTNTTTNTTGQSTQTTTTQTQTQTQQQGNDQQ